MTGVAAWRGQLCSAVMIFNLQHICFNHPTLKTVLFSLSNEKRLSWPLVLPQFIQNFYSFLINLFPFNFNQCLPAVSSRKNNINNI